jgi:hypothetical protein
MERAYRIRPYTIIDSPTGSLVTTLGPCELKRPAGATRPTGQPTIRRTASNLRLSTFREIDKKLYLIFSAWCGKLDTV